MIHNTPRSGLLGPRSGLLGRHWIDLLRPQDRAIFRPSLTIDIGAATGAGPTAISAFDAALCALGAGNANLIRLSSVIPPRAVLRRGRGASEPVPWGDRLYCVYAVQHASGVGATAAAGIGWALRDDGSGAGLFVEHEAETTDEVSAQIHASLGEMVGNRPEDFGPVRLCTTETRSEGAPVCALVMAAYQNIPWNSGTTRGSGGARR
ncbi:pyruvoyl-dependent arginine decarboxylase [Nocardia callitridis]